LKNTEALAGCASIMRTSILLKSGLSDPDFFYGPEDIELSRRMIKRPGNLIVDLNNKIYHSITQSFINLDNRRLYYEYKYRLVLIKKIGSMTDKIFGYTMYLIKLFAMCLLFIKYKKKILPVYLAFFHFLSNKYGDYDRKTKVF